MPCSSAIVSAVQRLGERISFGFITDACILLADCGSSLYSQPESMEGVTIIKTGTLDNGDANIPVQVEFYVKDRLSYMKPLEGAGQLQTME